jgi:Uncharacterised protein family (UPF0158)
MVSIMKISNEKLSVIINEIAEELECTNVCYFNPKTLELIHIPAQIVDEGDLDGFFDREMDIIENRSAEFICFEKLDSSDSFRIMADFVENLPKSKIESTLSNALNGSKPFRNFNNLIHESELREEWFNHRKNAVINYVKEIMEMRLLDFER